MWKRNVLFGALCLVGLGGLSAMLLQSERLTDPPGLDLARYDRPDYRQPIGRVNDEFRDRWAAAGVVPAARVDDLQLARRLSLALTGTVPSLEEIRALEKRPPEARLEWWLSRLLADRRYSDYVGERLARAYVGTDAGPFLLFRRRRFVTWLSDQLAVNRPYDQLVHELLTAKGLWTDAPAVNFVTATANPDKKNQPDEIKLAGRTARAFLATRIDCLQCHDDKLGTVELGTADDRRYGEQQDFHGLAAFFSGAQNSLFGIRDGTEDYRYTLLDEPDESVIAPQAPFLDELVATAPTRREQLARWVTHPDNLPFARAAVNRVWALLFGKPLVDPIDNIPLYGPYPPGLETLANDFVDHGYDWQRLIRIIAATEVFQLSSAVAGGEEVTVQQEEAWAVFPLTRLRPEQVAGGIIQAATLSTIDANAHIVSQFGRFLQQRNFVIRYGDTGEDEFVDHAGTITQRLLMMNGELVRDRTKENPLLNAATRISLLAPDDRTAVETAYLTVLSRRPSQQELEHFVSRLAGKEQSARSQCLEDIYWALINSSEFSWNH